MSELHSIIINRAEVHQTELKSFTLPTSNEFSDGSVMFKLNIFGLSTNNITYAVKGNEMGYWNFFPASDNTSQLPVWGYGEVVASQHPHFNIGDNYYGYFPMASHIIVQPDNITPFGFVDTNPTRNGMHPVYDYYVDTRTDVTYKKEDEALQVLYRPLFFTSYLLHDYVAQSKYFDAHKVIVTSASSKTAYGFAAIIHDEIQQGKKLELVGMTSARNIEFVKSLDIYSSVMTYEELDRLNDETSTIVIDHTGNQDLLKNIAKRLGNSHKYTALIGAVQNDNLDIDPSGPKHGKFFFAPIQAQKCIDRWGHAKFNQHYAKAWSSFKDKATSWVDLERLENLSDAQSAYLELLSGSPSPRKGIIVELR